MTDPAPATAAQQELRDGLLRDMVAGFLRGYTGPPEVAAAELIRMIRSWDFPSDRTDGAT